MDADELLDLICDPERTLDDVAWEIDQHLPPEQISDSLLFAVRGKLLDQSEHGIILRGMLPGARLSPRGTAAALDVYGMWVNRLSITQIDINLLRVAGWAYRWAGDELGRARALVNLAEGLYIRDSFDEALRASQEARDFFESVGHQAGAEKARLVQANTYVEIQQFAQAEELFTALLDTMRPYVADPDADVDDLIRYVELLNAYAFAVEYLGDHFARALELYAESERLLPRTGPYAGNVFRLNYNRGLLEQRLGRIADARRSFDQSQIWFQRGMDARELTSADAYDLYQAQLTMALQLADRPRAHTLLDQLDALAQQGETSPKQRAESDRLRALLLPQSQIDEFTGLMRSAITAFEQIGANLLVLTCYTDLAERAYGVGQIDLGTDALHAARRMLTGHAMPRRQLDLDRIGAQYDSAMPLAERIAIADHLIMAGDYLGAAAVWEMIGGMHERSRDRAAARVAYDRALDAVAQARGMVRMSLHTLRLSAVHRRAAERAFILATDDGAAFIVGERMRAQSLLDELSNAGLWRLLERADLSEIRAAYEQLSYTRARLSLRQARLRRPTIEGEEAGTAQATLVWERQRAEATYFAALDRLATDKATRAGWITGSPATLEEIRAALPSGAIFVALTLVGAVAEGELWATMLDHQGALQRVRLAKRGQWQQFLKQWGAGDLISCDPEPARRMLQELYVVFVERIEPALEHASALIIAPDESLPLYPIHAAFDGKQYLIERMPVSYVPSGSVLALLRQRQTRRAPLSAVQILGYDASSEAGYPTLSNLPAELEVLTQIVGGQQRHGPLEPETLLEVIAQARLIHLSCHGEFPLAASPRFAQLITGPRRLYADDLYRADLAADLLFLDACHSGQVGPGMQGFVGAALVSGASSVIAAMWQVEYQAARPLVRSFYQHWRAGLPAAEALRQAQLAQIAGQQTSPGRWAHFYLMGLPDLFF